MVRAPRQPRSRPAIFAATSAWNDISATGLIVSVIAVLAVWFAIEVLVAGWQWLHAAVALVGAVSTQAQGAVLLAAMVPARDLTQLTAVDPNLDPALARVLSLEYAKRNHDRYDSSFEHSAFGAHDFSQVLCDIREADAREIGAAS